MFRQIEVDLQKDFINFRYTGDDTIVFQTQKNQFIENSGLTIKNPAMDIPAYGIQLNQWGPSLLCGHIISNIAGRLQEQDMNNIILIIDFDGITEVSESFCEEYFAFMLTTSSKIININQNTSINNAFVNYIDSVVDYQEV